MARSTVQSRILTSWRAIELFSAQKTPPANPNDKTKPVFRVLGSEPLPWQASHALHRRKLRPKQTWRHTVYAGLFTSTAANELLDRHFGENPDTFDRPGDCAYCLFAFEVDKSGRPLLDTFALSSLAWALGRTLSPGPSSPDWLTGFFETEKAAREDFEHRHALRDEKQDSSANHDETLEPDLFDNLPTDQDEQEHDEHGIDDFDTPEQPLDHDDLIAEILGFIDSLGVGPLIDSPKCRVSSTIISEKNDESKNEPVLLNSFFVDDLDRVAIDIQVNTAGKALTNYLTAPEDLDEGLRVDVNDPPDTTFETLSPAFFPIARWPSPKGHSLVASQQFAVNNIAHSLDGSSGIAAVNGPPGTGKTTLLRDLIANIYVTRAQRLAELDSPKDAFEESTGWKAGDYQRTVWHWKEAFHGYEIVIASSNNGAVANVTMEIPGVNAIDTTSLDGMDHFQDLASHILGDDKEAWGLMAAKLGNRTNRNEFRSRFWFDRDADEAEQPKLPGMKSLLDAFSQETVDWHAAVDEFNIAVELSEHLQEERQHICEQGIRIRTLSKKIAIHRSRHDELQTRLSHSEDALAQAIHEVTLARNMLEASRNERLDHRRFRPGLVEIIFTLGKTFRKWRAKDEQLEIVTEADESNLSSAIGSQSVLATMLSDQQFNYRAAHDHLTELTDKHSRLSANQSRTGKNLGIDIPDPESEDWSNDTKRELSSPWVDETWNEARSQVFVAALALHRAFIRANAVRMRQSLHAAMDVLAGSVPDDAPADTVADAWRALFFVVPVISTTFASFARLFPQMGRESLGWLLVDEAGQALPQQAVGALWRARRAVVVGDPLQLEPIVSISLKAQEALRQYHDVDQAWTPGTMSVQRLADRASPYGTYINSGDEPVWVGSPLRVHRRCAAPMFDICNSIAYDGLMVNGLINKDSSQPVVADWPVSCWIDIRSAISDGHWVEAEGEAMMELLEQLMSLNVDASQIFLISPFRTVSDQLRARTKRFEGINAGTVHTTQGKEANIVVLVLGSDPSSAGARQWASSKPNLLNVAVSRAKRRLYVIGDLSKWRQCNYFSTCADRLERHAKSETLEMVERPFVEI
ncbi:DEAD/DEAH box helicase [Granulosicoccus antarcticus]|uniref:RecBCD enzyme subunit RecD n=1 Tax=Granulosicoccus antarcticus IMCC3135 TaxID=1192854 RepID=A0A2Z2NHQ0_9GAMM|nr:ATP-binding protein [Granulosicoccus antarcticus]ASJ70669.1 RecBCD enzyme subunit RecD [Granulosicoccus antarcticus IMCC3135]